MPNRRARVGWHGQGSTPRTWSVAAFHLIQAHEIDSTPPIDPELYVASQPRPSASPNPWLELTGPPAVRRYADQIKQIVRSLRKEIREEIRQAEKHVPRGHETRTVLESNSRRISPLARYIVGHRAGLPVLAREFLSEAAKQHESCPLYREACRGLIGPELYPDTEDHRATEGPTELRGATAHQYHLN